MKKLNIALISVAIFSFVSTIVFLIILPEIIPVGFTLDGGITAFGSKNVYIWLPVIVGGISLLSLFSCCFRHKQIKIKKAIVITALVLASVVAVLGFITLLQISILELSVK